MPQQPLPPKKDVALALLERSSVFVHLDPRGDLAVVPPWFKKQPQLVLQVGLNMPVPIPDLRVDDAGLSCTLSFNRSPFHCVVPWARVFALVGEDGRGMVWPDDLPAELARPEPAPRPRVVPAPEETDDAPPARAATKGQAKEAAKGEGKKKSAAKRGKRSADAGEPQAAAAEPEARRGPRAVPPPPETEEEAKAKRQRKKPRIVPPPAPEARGPLVAVPSPGAPRRPPSRGSGKPKKREIPPYLRVVK